jgi:hypothetical protein
MKNLSFFAAIFFLFCLSCGDKAGKTPDTLESNTNTLDFDYAASNQYISLSSNADWTVEASDKSWIDCSPASGTGNNRVKVSVTENKTKAARQGTVTLKTTGGKTCTVSVTQLCEAPAIVVNPVSVTPLAAGEELTIGVSANDDWDVTIPADAQSWVSNKSQTATSAVLSFAGNDTENDRSTTVSFKLKSSGVKADLAVSQKKKTVIPTIEIDPKSFNANSDGDTVTVNVTTGVEWKVTIPATDPWVTVKTKTNSSVELAIDANTTGSDRTSTLVFETADGLASANFVITQAKGYVLTTTMSGASQELANQDPLAQSRSGVNNYIKTYGFDYSENPHCTGGYGGDDDNVHDRAEWDAFMNRYVFRMDIHITPVIDGDRCSSSTTDRQRNEMKSATNNTIWAKVQGNYDEWQVIEWKFKLPAGFQPTSAFCHIHQLKAQDGPNNGSALITITPRAASNGTNKRIQIIHSVDGGTGTGLGTVIEVPMADFEDQWVQVREEIHYTHTGYYSCRITRVSDGKVLLTYSKSNIDMWRAGASYIRNKYGIYRSLNGGDLSKNPVGQDKLLKNESIWLCDFNIYEKNTNPNPGVAHD